METENALEALKAIMVERPWNPTSSLGGTLSRRARRAWPRAEPERCARLAR